MAFDAYDRSIELLKSLAPVLRAREQLPVATALVDRGNAMTWRLAA